MDEKTAEMYLILAENGESTVPQILELTQLSRATVYDVLPQLLADDFIEYRKDGRVAYYRAVHPTKLLELLDQKKRQLSLLEEEMTETVRQVVGSFQLANSKPGVRFFEGIEGIMEVINDSLSAKGDILTYLDVEATQKYISGQNKEYVNKRVELGIHKRMIAPNTPATRERYRNYNPNIEVRLMPPDIKPFETSVQMYNDTISFSSLDEEKMIGVLIEDKKIVQLHKSIFEFVWKSLPKLTYSDSET